MFRTVTSRSSGVGARALATGSPVNPTVAPSGPPTTPPPPKPTSAPPAGPGLIRRFTPVLLSAGAGFFMFRLVTDNDFRDSVEKVVPSAAVLLNRIPSMDPSSPHIATDASASVSGSADKAGSTLPPGYDTVPNLLRKIEEAKTTTSSDESTAETHDQSESLKPTKNATVTAVPDRQGMTPTERAASKTVVQNAPSSLDTVGDGPIRTRKVVPAASPPEVGKKSAAISLDKSPAEKKPTLAEILTSDEGEETQSHNISEAIANAPARTSGKEKLARILGKGDFNADEVEGSDVVDDSVYKKPKPWPSSSVSSSRGSGWKSKRSSWKAGTSSKQSLVESDQRSSEMDALRSELQSQIKWEAVRLQEALRAQVVEDKKIAAKEAAEIANKHAAELTRAREDAMLQAQNMLADRTREMKAKTEAERDADVLRLLKLKEEELRESLVAEFTEKERAEALEREKALLEAKAQVAGLSEQFDAVVMQTEKAKEAAKRTGSAFLLRQTVSSCRPIGEQLSEAAGKTELGQLVVQSIPEAAVKVGVQTLDMLQAGFAYVSKQGLSVAMVPESKTGTIWGHLLGAVFSRLKIPVDSRDDDPSAVPSTNEGRIRLAKRLVEEGNLSRAILTLEQLNGVSAEVMSDWLEAAKARVAADLAAEVLLADAIIAQVTLSGGA